MGSPPELGSEKFARWWKVLWPAFTGIFGMFLVILDALLNGTVNWNGIGGAGLLCIGVIPFEVLRQFHKGGGS